MKIYNEVNYKWEDGKLIETSSDSFEYSGDITLCAKGGNPVGKVLDTTVDYLNKGSDAVHGTVDFLEDTGKKASHMAFGSNVFGEDPDDPISYAAGDKGADTTHGAIAWTKDFGEKVSHHAFGSNTYADEEEEPIEYAAGEDEATAEVGPAKKKDLVLAGRGASDLTAGQTASLITG